MVDRVIDSENDAPEEEIPEILDDVLTYVLNIAADKMDREEELIPFTGLSVNGNVFIKEHDYETTEETYLSAREEVENAEGAEAYSFCYDGFIQTDDGVCDCIIAEGGLPGESEGYAFGCLYDDEGIDREVVYIGPAPNFMENM